MKKLLLVLSVVFISSIGYGQNLKIGVRTGLGSYKLAGELEANETQTFSWGFHFAITGTYKFSDKFGLRTELGYIQKSTQQEFNDNFATIFNIPTVTGDIIKVAEFGGNKYSLKKTFNIFSIPLHAVFKPTKKIELFAGVDLDFVAGVIGQGSIEFDNHNDDNRIIYNQTLNYNYTTDVTGRDNVNSNDVLTINYDWDNDGEDDKILLPKSLSAYYYRDSEEGKAHATFDLALSGGVSYFINPGLYVRVTGNYGLFDSTKSGFDYSLQEVNADASYIYRDDNDHKIGVQFSVGFQF